MTDSQPAAPDQMPSSPKASAARMYAAVVGVGIVCALAIVSVYESTKAVIRRNTIEFRNQAILDVLPKARTSAAFRFSDAGNFERTSPDDADAHLIFAGYDADHNLVGLALETEGMGYQDVVRVLYGYSFEQQAIVGIRVLQSRETPGLGDRIETDADFLRNFEALDVQVEPSQGQLAHPIEFVKPGEKHAGWQIDGISGATITSRATANMLRESSQTWIPRVYPRRADFQFQRQKGPVK